MFLWKSSSGCGKKDIFYCMLLNNAFQSEAVGDAIYEHDWHNADLAYKKMLIQIIVRSQKQANIRAPTFPPTSYETFMGVMSTSYKFLTVLRQCLNRA